MWSMMPRPATAALIAAALTALAGPASADAAATAPTYKYMTTGTIGDGTGSHSIALSGTNDISTMAIPGTFTLGTFATNPLLPGESVTYADTPFRLDLKVGPNDATVAAPGDFSPLNEYMIRGTLSGTIRSDGTSTLVPTIIGVSGGSPTAPFSPADLVFGTPPIVAPAGTMPGFTGLTATINVDANGNPLPAPAGMEVPEPTSVAVFAAALAGWAWTRRRRA